MLVPLSVSSVAIAGSYGSSPSHHLWHHSPPSLNIICSHKMQPTLSSPTTLSLRSPAGFCGVSFGGESRQLWSPRAAGVGARKLSCTRASLGEEQRSNREPRLLHSELKYFGKLSAGCVAGAILVKYGSLAAPEITNPNIDEALLIIGTPVAASLVLLTLASVLGSDWIRTKQ